MASMYSSKCDGASSPAGGLSLSRKCGSRRSTRAETVAEKPMFRDAFKRRRCLIPASGYYEWHDTPEGKQPHYFTRRDGQMMTFAAIQDAWNDPQSGERIRSCAMIISEPSKFVAGMIAGFRSISRAMSGVSLVTRPSIPWNLSFRGAAKRRARNPVNLRR